MVLASFILDTSVLIGDGFVLNESIIEGRGRSIQVKWTQAGLDQDLVHLGYSIRFAPAETEAKE